MVTPTLNKQCPAASGQQPTTKNPSNNDDSNTGNRQQLEETQHEEAKKLRQNPSNPRQWSCYRIHASPGRLSAENSVKLMPSATWSCSNASTLARKHRKTCQNATRRRKTSTKIRGNVDNSWQPGRQFDNGAALPHPRPKIRQIRFVKSPVTNRK